MASFTRPTYVDQGIQKLGSGIFWSYYRVLKADMHSDSFFTVQKEGTEQRGLQRSCSSIRHNTTSHR